MHGAEKKSKHKTRENKIAIKEHKQMELKEHIQRNEN